MVTWPNMLFYIVFLSQIFLISYYFPAKLLVRMRSVLETYPPSEYPKLYVKPIEYYKIGQGAFKLVNRFIFLLGFVILLLIVFVVDQSTFADDGYVSEAWPSPSHSDPPRCSPWLRDAQRCPGTLSFV